jgi:hypothetical protein
VRVEGWTDFYDHRSLPIGGILAAVKATRPVECHSAVDVAGDPLLVNGCLDPPLTGVPITIEVTDAKGRTPSSTSPRARMAAATSATHPEAHPGFPAGRTPCKSSSPPAATPRRPNANRPPCGFTEPRRPKAPRLFGRPSADGAGLVAECDGERMLGAVQALGLRDHGSGRPTDARASDRGVSARSGAHTPHVTSWDEVAAVLDELRRLVRRVGDPKMTYARGRTVS